MTISELAKLGKFRIKELNKTLYPYTQYIIYYKGYNFLILNKQTSTAYYIMLFSEPLNRFSEIKRFKPEMKQTNITNLCKTLNTFL